MIEALAADGVPVAEAIRSAGMPQADYDRWRLEQRAWANARTALVRDA